MQYDIDDLLEELFLDIEKSSEFTDGDIIKIKSDTLYELILDYQCKLEAFIVNER